MVQDKHNVVPVSMAVLLHIVLVVSMVFGFDFGASNTIAVPLAIKGTLVTDNAVVIPPKVEEPEPEPLPEPDTSEQERLAAEEQKRQEDARIEQERLNRIREQEVEQKRVAAETERKRVADAEKRKREAEAETERKRVEAERKREQEIERQRAENERLRREADAAARQEELDAEARRLAARSADTRAAYMFAIQQDIARNWVRPPTAEVGLECTVNVRQLPGGEVIDVSLGSCNGDAAVQRSIVVAVEKASPLPAPRDPSDFDRNLTLIFRPTD